MNIIRMMNWSDYSKFLIRSLSLTLFCLSLSTHAAHAQDTTETSILNVDETTEEFENSEFPQPRQVMLKSLMVPGWGQTTNNQIWKVPIVYGMLGGLIWNSVRLTKRFHDFRAAAFNAQVEGTEMDDMRFGPTPDFLQGDFSVRFLTERRDELRNNRDLMYILTGVAYGLNVLDAYVTAHMKTFNVSDDLSANASFKPSLIEGSNPGFTLSISLKPRNKK